MRVGSILSAVMLALSVPAFAQESGTLKKLRDTGEIVLGVRDASIPFSYADETGKSIVPNITGPTMTVIHPDGSQTITLVDPTLLVNTLPPCARAK